MVTGILYCLLIFNTIYYNGHYDFQIFIALVKNPSNFKHGLKYQYTSTYK